VKPRYYFLLFALLPVSATRTAAQRILFPSTDLAARLAQDAVRSSPTEKEKKETCTVSGLVVKLTGGEPIKAAIVLLRQAEDPNQGYRALTDPEGHFEIKDVEAGRYRLEVSHAGFVTLQFAQKKPDDPGALLTLSPGDSVTDRIFRLAPAAVIAGRIMDEDGQPLPWVMVTAMREVYNEGKRKLATEAFVNTNDLGEYRLFGLPPGHYFVSALYRVGGHRFGGENSFKDLGESKTDRGYVTTYYPGSTDVTHATLITVQEGEELPSMDMLLRQVGVFKVRGRVYNSVTRHSGGDIYLDLAPKNSRLNWAFITNNYTNVQKDGSFELQNILAGSYTLSAYWFDEGKFYATHQPIEIANTDIDGITLTIAPGMNIEGHLTWEGNPSLEQEELRILANGETGEYAGGDARVLANGAFTLKNISEGTYRLGVTGISPDCYVKSVRYGTSDATQEGFTVHRGTDAALDVTVSSRGARVKGNVTDADGLPAPGVWIALVPEEKHRGEFRLYKTKTTDQHGHFELRGIAPGEYKLFSWQEVESQAWEDSEFLKPFEKKGEKISFEDGAEKTVNLTAIPKQTPEAKP
jgi:protocatechuate 3,4-dioxygenase beta subunit